MAQLKNPQQLFPMFVTSNLEATKRFYLDAGFEVRFDMAEYLQVTHHGVDLCFMKPDAPSNREGYPAFKGQGVVVSIPTPSADEKSAELQKRRIPILSRVEDKPWGWRSFHVKDPNGVILDFFHVYKEVPMPNEPS